MSHPKYNHLTSRQGEIFRYTLESSKRDSRELLTLQTWVVDRALRGVPG